MLFDNFSFFAYSAIEFTTGNLYLHSHERKSVINFVLTAVFPPFCVNQYRHIDTVSWTTPPLWQADNESENLKKEKEKKNNEQKNKVRNHVHELPWEGEALTMLWRPENKPSLPLYYSEINPQCKYGKKIKYQIHPKDVLFLGAV